MFFLLGYALIVWAVSYTYRRRWPAFIAPFVSLVPIAALVHLDVMLVFRASGQSGDWLYFVGGAFGLLIVGVSLLIAVQPRVVVQKPCPVCRYELDGVEGPVCPECGCDPLAPRPRRSAPGPATPRARTSPDPRVTERLKERRDAAMADASSV